MKPTSSLPWMAAIKFLFALFLIFLLSIPILSLDDFEQQTSQVNQNKPTTSMSIKQLSYDQSDLSVQSQSVARPISYSHSQAVLSLSGTLGDNGWYTSDVEATLYSTGDDSDSTTTEYALYNQPWTTFEEPFTIFEEGQTTIYYRVRDEDTDYVGETKFSMIDIDKTPPKISVTIDEGFKDAFSTTVTLTLSMTDEPSGPTTLAPSGYIWGVPSGPSDMRVSNDGHVWSPWEPIANEKTWLMTSGGGMKTVYVQARDNAGLVSEPFSDTINLITTKDSAAPATKITVNGEKNTQGVYTSAVAITLSAVDDLSGVGLTEYSFGENNWTTYANPIPLYAEGQTTISYRSQDTAGNMEPTATFTIDIDLIEKSEPLSPLIIFGIVISVSAFSLIAVLKFRKRSPAKNLN
jgi:hypothetical protein